MGKLLMGKLLFMGCGDLIMLGCGWLRLVAVKYDWLWVDLVVVMKLWLVVGGGSKVMAGSGCWQQNCGLAVGSCWWLWVVARFSNARCKDTFF